MQGVQGLTAQQRTQHLAVAVGAVFCSWVLLHSLFTIRYAHLYYGHPAERAVDFPGTDQPDYLDFAYFSFVIGMTGQVSDVSIRSQAVRRLALLHGLVSFLFNTIIIAITINLLAGML